MRYLPLLLLLAATNAHAFTSMTGTLLVTSCPTPTCTVTAGGESITVDGIGDTSFFIHAYALGEQSINATGSCVNAGPYTHEFQISQNGGYWLNDQNATFNVTRVDNCPTQIIITGSNPVAYSVVANNPHTDEFGRLAYDFTFTSTVGIVSGGGNGETEPPIVRH